MTTRTGRRARVRRDPDAVPRRPPHPAGRRDRPLRTDLQDLYILRLADEPGYRRQIKSRANLQEGRHSLVRKIFHGRSGQLYQRYQDGIEDLLTELPRCEPTSLRRSTHGDGTEYQAGQLAPEAVLAYLEQADQGIRAQLTAAQEDARTPDDKVRAVGRAIADGIGSEDFRCCAFLNAAAEYPDPAHPIHQAVLAHRQWFLGTVTDLLARVGNAPAELAGRHFVMLRDGAMAAGCLSEPGLITETFMEGVEGILRARSAACTAS